MNLRPASLADVPALAALGRTGFTAAFGHLYSAADLAHFLDQTHREAFVADEITAPHALYRLAESGGELVGYCKLRHPTKLGTHSAARDPIELVQLYTAPDRTGEGIGAALLEWALDAARERGHDAILLCVYSENFGAQRFYARYGFAKIADIQYPVGQQLDHEFLFEKRLSGE